MKGIILAGGSGIIHLPICAFFLFQIVLQKTVSKTDIIIYSKTNNQP